MHIKHFLYITVACVLFIVIYSPLQLYFLSDDWDSLLFSLHPQNILHSFRPLSDATLYIDYALWQLNAANFHLTNLILHFGCVFCFYFFSKNLFSLQNNEAVSAKLALLCCLLFLFYPFHSEALFWIVGRGAVLCTFFGLLSFLFYMRKKKKMHHYFFSLLFFIAALFSYEEAWIIPVLVVIWEILKQKSDRSFKSVFPFWLLFILYLAGRFFFTKAVIGTPYGAERIVAFDFFGWCKNIAALMFRSVVPPIQSSSSFAVACAIIAVVFLITIIIIRKKMNPLLLISAAGFILTLLPVIPLGIDTHDTESERFLYFPSLFFILFCTELLHILFSKKISYIFPVLLAAESFALWQSYNSFAVSSMISEKTISALTKTGFADTLFCNQLPNQYKGAFIFRNGFKSAVTLVKKDSVKTVIISSESELYHPANNYKAVFLLSPKTNTNSVSPNKNMIIEWKEDEVIISR